jgi:hypothetical protein
MGLFIGVATAILQYGLLHKLVGRITNNRSNGHKAARLLLYGKLVIWAAVLAGVALISLEQLLWAAGAMMATTFGLSVWKHIRIKKA